ncbi:MAG: hypothetical protein HDKAJFGB_00912 [Anaerolineae bacterium]|nr:hypothetical protein [Anaerolineae bacterium]
MLARGDARFGIVGGEQIFKDFAEQFGVERDFLFKRRIFVNRKFVAVQEPHQPAHLVLFIFRAKDLIQLRVVARLEITRVVFVGEKEIVWHIQFIGGMVRETIHAQQFVFAVAFHLFVETFKETAVEKGNVAREREPRVGIRKIGFVTIAIVRHEIVGALSRFGFMPKRARPHFGIERAEKEILQNRSVIRIARGGEIGEQLTHLFFVKEGGRHEVFFLNEPRKDEACDEANERGGVAFRLIFSRAARK